jgi:hypothetical protein
MAGRVPRDGRRSRIRARIAWGLLAADAAAFAAICAFFDSLGTPLGPTVMAATMVAAIALFVWGIQEAFAAQRFGSLEGGKGVVASWIVDADTWRQRMAIRTQKDRQSIIQAQGLALLPKKAPPGGIEIVVGDAGIYIGDYNFLPMYPWYVVPVQIRDDWIELELPADSSTYLLRLPIGREGRAAADKVVQYFRDRPGPASEQVPRPGG